MILFYMKISVTAHAYGLFQYFHLKFKTLDDRVPFYLQNNLFTKIYA